MVVPHELHVVEANVRGAGLELQVGRTAAAEPIEWPGKLQ